MSAPEDGHDVLRLISPLPGWVLPLAEIPDPVFAGGMAGDGLAIDPTGNVLHAPCDGVVVLMGGARHAVTLRSGAGDVLLHAGIDTVSLGGEGFSLRVLDGEPVRAGQPLLEFDLDAIVRRAPSAVTPVLLVGARPGQLLQPRVNRRVAVGDFLFAIDTRREPAAPALRAAAPSQAAVSHEFRVPFDHGLHARPAARVAGALAGLDAQVMLRARGREASARSTVAMMALGVERGDLVVAQISGRESEAALAALARLLERVTDAAPVRAPRPPSKMPTHLAPVAGDRLRAIIAARGLAVGVAVPLQGIDPPVGAALGDAKVERDRLSAAIDAVSGSLRELAAIDQGARRGVLDAHVALLADPGLHEQARARIARGASAGAAWRETLRAAAAALAALDDPRMAERRADLLDIERQVLRVLGGAPPSAGVQLPDRAIVLASELLPSQLLTLDVTRLAGLCMAEGGATSHVAILAASMGLPMLVAAGAAVLEIPAGTSLVLDAEEGQLLVAPPAAAQARVMTQIEARERERAQDAASAAQPACTREGTRVHVYCNLGALAEAAPAVAAGAEGCGLLRTEFLFLERAQAPDEDEQLAEYQAIARALEGRTLTVRTLDAGGDKPIAYLPLPHEDNPALGLRGLRTSLARPELLAAQLRAIVRVAPAGQCRVLLPMVTEPDEVRGVRAQLAAIAAELKLNAPQLGIMIETPASALLADLLCAEIDFVSIGSNDLSQYTLAMDRLHPTLAPRLDGVHPAVLRLIQRAAQAGAERGIEVGVCGALASDAAAVPLLLGLGVRELSVVPAQIARIKGLVRRVSLADCAQLARRALELDSAAAVRALVREWS
ncbi:MAG: phosphoenolpyruvate--protein phosphotransferase, partial [Proteobacteria bacterium]|nr:phosphoenolpyruvate--protein phosphotransferase [Pseudomonadota bacterium]